MEGKSKRMDRKERLKNENSPAPLNHNVRHIKRIKEGNIIATSIKPMDVGHPGSWEKTKRMSLQTPSLVLQAFLPT